MDYLQTQGIKMPRLGLGTFRMQGDVCRAAVESRPADLGRLSLSWPFAHNSLQWLNCGFTEPIAPAPDRP